MNTSDTQILLKDSKILPKGTKYQNIWACSYNLTIVHITVIHIEHTNFEKTVCSKNICCSTGKG